MSNEAVLIYPHQLFREHPALAKSRLVVLVEEPLFFSQYTFHKKKIAYHRATMKRYEDLLSEDGYDVAYVEAGDLENTGSITEELERRGIEKVYCAELDDDWLERRLSEACAGASIAQEFVSSPGFLTPLNWSIEFFKSKKNYFQTSFYIAQRKRLDILCEEDQEPVGGQWTFDKENRKKLPRGYQPPEIHFPDDDAFVKEAHSYVEEHFSENPGSLEGIRYPCSHDDAERWLEDFIENRLELFGDYQDAISKEDSFLNHSLLTPMLNTGLITPIEIVERVIERHGEKEFPLNSLEGFIRQIIGWREYFRAVYALESVPQRTKNFFGFSRKIPPSFWTGDTGIPPIDNIINRVLENAYAHHIERLMILGNFMLLCEFDPDEVYRWFMELFIDAYDWVMVPNVYGMSQHADGGLITTKPYISSSNYVRKMSNFKSGEWCDIWDGLYWNFLASQRKLLERNSRMSLMYKQLDKMDSEKLKKHRETASEYLSSLG